MLTEIPLNDSNPYITVDTVDSLDWNPTSDQIAIGGDVMTYLYSLEDKELKELKEEPGTGAFVTWSADGLKLAGTERRLWVWDSQTDRLIYNVNKADSYRYYLPAFWSQDGNSLLSTLWDWPAKTSHIEVWDITTGEVRPLEIPGAANPGVVDWSPDDRFVAIRDDNHPAVQIIELSSGKVIHVFPDEEIRPAVWDSSGTKLVTGAASGDFTVWDTTNWQPIVTLPSQGEFKYSVEWHPQGNYIAAAGPSGVIIWNVNSATSTIVHDQKVFDVAWSRDGKRLATAVGDTVYIWDVAQLP